MPCAADAQECQSKEFAPDLCVRPFGVLLPNSRFLQFPGKNTQFPGLLAGAVLASLPVALANAQLARTGLCVGDGHVKMVARPLGATIVNPGSSIQGKNILDNSGRQGYAHAEWLGVCLSIP